MPTSEAHNIDCMEYMRQFPDKHFELAVVDPPYGDAMTGIWQGGNGRFEGGNTFAKYKERFGGRFDKYKGVNRSGGGRFAKYGERIIGWDFAPSEDYFAELFRVSKNQIIWGANYFPNMPPTRCFLVWRKLTISESFSMAMCEYAWTSFNGNAKWFECAPQGTAKEQRFHPTQKPVALYAWIFKNFAKEGDKILDTHLGSGSSRIAAYKMGFDFYSAEIDKDYYDRQEERFRKECFGETRTKKGILIEQSLFPL